MRNYKKWIKEKSKENNPYGKCKEWCHEMQKVFPELKMVRGFYHCLLWGKREHWWLIMPNGEIVDPTLKQFPFSLGEYEEWKEGEEEPTGKCVVCGEYCYRNNSFCSSFCKLEMKKEIPNII